MYVCKMCLCETSGEGGVGRSVGICACIHVGGGGGYANTPVCATHKYLCMQSIHSYTDQNGCLTRLSFSSAAPSQSHFHPENIALLLRTGTLDVSE